MNAPHAQSLADADRDVRQHLIRIAGVLGSELGDALTGLYVHGSLATGAFHRERSSLDLLGVSSRALSPHERERIARMLVHLSDARPTWGDIDLTLLREDRARNFVHPPPYELRYSASLRQAIRRRELDFSSEQSSVDLAARVVETRERGLPLVGSPAAAMFGPVPWYAYMNALQAEFAAAREHVESSPVHATLSACRILYAATRSEIATANKDEAAVWALATVPRMYHSVINDTLQLYRGTKATDDVIFMKGEVIAFREYVRERSSAAFRRASDTGEDDE
ncbi:MAG TPA: aminoglycoside adenylyltransferase domain-containing protein [Candidatus Baltobacteraceae bacterium]|jgi:streptomycin 3"-adenylyltransferase|nr:aminoglycoside adenylyltransferase domain-containing protein [Candidatus Baltobacteraceae bacterium]